jgi:hypothetical protein
MKVLFAYFLLIFFIAFHFAATAQDDLSKTFELAKQEIISDHVELGKPVAEKNSKSIGPEGGTVSSVDGKMKLIVPQGALTQPTTISIQPVSNLSATGIGNAYDCEPSGLQFLVPATAVFNYSDSEINKNNPALQDLGWLDKQGEWHALEKISIDSINKTISGNVMHFSEFTRKFIFEVSQPNENLHVNKTTSKVRFSGLIPDKYGDIKTNRTEVINNFFENERYRWYVNGIENGDAVNGKISFKGFTPHGMIANYTAPPSIPADNPVKITVEMDGPIALRNGATVPGISASAYVNVVGDQYHYTYIHVDENGCYFMVDSSSCVINMDKEKTTISNIINYKPWSDWPNCGGCKYDWTNKATIKGLAEINGMASVMVTPPGDQSSATKVYITLVPAMGNTPSATVHCKKDTRNTPSMPMPAEPRYISFDIDGDDLVIHYMGKTARNELVIRGPKEKVMIYMYRLN